ncbi:site-specific DNA-methyltransferase [Enterococcus faecalis]|uniref:site-specific DNA-methyltransferase n=2 Tax=Bacillota TaxID=1239 RepID=UPI000813ABBC|nr:site-specific DNA-methyltransferase [Enterococcus faecalis]EGO5143833.1 site-specific DNA-methyltransferase [Enterococcus faecalis]EGO5856874.1 site-specific DNA-methyltransferase [Enterococcus faecalis]EGO7502791.1 site-specific DNA-methyltransferase [Enterococcus faecalis]EGO7838024.1 site-specific DNA-methyltransferase [Enterococcus faecalis]EGO7996916.1 site-specific DNA-methyltransferase [Enterococcus faecalis]
MIKDTWEKNENASANKKEITVLKEHFPACFKEDGSFDIERFKEYLSEDINVINEGYELKFLGKNYARLLVTLETETVIVPNEEHNQKKENKDSENIYITGDNLDGLKHLLKSYAGKVKCIYIDPPYNTGSDGFVYNDNFNFTIEELIEKLSIGEEQAQRILDLTKRGAASHSAWLMFMYPRLQLARDLLSHDGVIFISIDDNEKSNLKLLCNDIFGEENLLASITNVNNPKGRSDDKYFATAHEYLLVYKREEVSLGTFDPEEKVIKRYRELDENSDYFRLIDLRKTGDSDLRTDREDMFYPFYYNETTEDLIIGDLNASPPEGYIEIFPMKTKEIEGRWRWGKNEKAMKNGFSNLVAVFMPQKQQWSVFEKDYLKNKKGVTPTTVWNYKDVNSERGTEEFVRLGFDKQIFPRPKPIGTIERCMKIGTESNDIILDFFSGSATTAHSVLSFNSKNKDSNLKYILIQLPEKIDAKYIHSEFETIDEIGRERIIRAANKIKQEKPNVKIDFGFKHFILKNPQKETINKLVDFNPEENKLFADKTLLDEFGVPTVITTWLNNDGYGLTTEAEKIMFAGYEAYYKDKHLYLVHPELPNESIEELVVKYETDGDFNPENIVLFGYSFTWTELESLKTNLKRLQDTEKNLRINFDIRY